jgi:hypothetical protein
MRRQVAGQPLQALDIEYAHMPARRVQDTLAPEL